MRGSARAKASPGPAILGDLLVRAGLLLASTFRGGPATTLFTLGHDPAKKRFVGTFLGSMMTNLWIYDGGLDAAEKVLTLDTEGPSFTDPNKTARYQDVIEVVSDEHRILSSQVLGDNGQWRRFMTAHYRRRR
jgi:hypothetical protein